MNKTIMARPNWNRLAGSLIDTVQLANQDCVNEEVSEQLERYFGEIGPASYEALRLLVGAYYPEHPVALRLANAISKLESL